MGKRKAVQSTTKGKAGNTGKVKNTKQRMDKHIDMEGSYLWPQPTTSSIVDTVQGNQLFYHYPIRTFFCFSTKSREWRELKNRMHQVQCVPVPRSQLDGLMLTYRAYLLLLVLKLVAQVRSSSDISNAVMRLLTFYDGGDGCTPK